MTGIDSRSIITGMEGALAADSGGVANDGHGYCFIGGVGLETMNVGYGLPGRTEFTGLPCGPVTDVPPVPLGVAGVMSETVGVGVDVGPVAGVPPVPVAGGGLLLAACVAVLATVRFGSRLPLGTAKSPRPAHR